MPNINESDRSELLYFILLILVVIDIKQFLFMLFNERSIIDSGLKHLVFKDSFQEWNVRGKTDYMITIESFLKSHDGFISVLSPHC